MLKTIFDWSDLRSNVRFYIVDIIKLSSVFVCGSQYHLIVVVIFVFKRYLVPPVIFTQIVLEIPIQVRTYFQALVKLSPIVPLVIISSRFHFQ